MPDDPRTPLPEASPEWLDGAFQRMPPLPQPPMLEAPALEPVEFDGQLLDTAEVGRQIRDWMTAGLLAWVAFLLIVTAPALIAAAYRAGF